VTLALLILVFLIAAAAVWLSGIKISDATDVLTTRLGLGEALGGLILLAFVTNLPEIAIVVSASLSHDLSIATGNILGGIAIQTVVLALLDGFGIPDVPLTYRAAHLALVIEGAVVVAILAVVVMGSRMSSTAIFLRVTPAGLGILALWLTGLWLVSRARTGLPWHESGGAPDGQRVPRGHRRKAKEQELTKRNISTRMAVVVFSIGAIVTLAGGVALERTGESISSRVGISGVLFGATVLAAATSLPEISTGLRSVKIGDFQLAVSDIFGGNAFLPVLFLVATLISGSAVLPEAQDSDVYLTSLGILLTVVYMVGLLFRPRRQWFHLGPDSLAVIAFYALGIAGLVYVTHG
jgi:cation:H+ antiporter